MPTNTINGHGHDDVFEVSDGMRVTITSSARGKLTIDSIHCFGWYGWKCLAGLELKKARWWWDQLPGWYKAEEKWWSPPKVQPLLPRDVNNRLA
jgi:hypothetical protein